MKKQQRLAPLFGLLTALGLYLGNNLSNEIVSSSPDFFAQDAKVAVQKTTSLEDTVASFLPPLFFPPAVFRDTLHQQLLEDAHYFQKEIQQWHRFMQLPEDSAVVIDKKSLTIKKQFPNERKILKAYFQQLADQDSLAYENALVIRGRRQKVAKALQRFTRYQKILQEPLQEQGISITYAMIPLIESHLQFPHSWAGALGPWQLLKPVAKKYIPVTKYVDARNSLVDASRAAAYYLKSLQEMYGYYGLVLIAYIRGPIGVAKDLEAMLDLHQKSEDFFGSYHQLLIFHENNNYHLFSYHDFKRKYNLLHPKAKSFSFGEWVNTYARYLQAITQQPVPLFTSWALAHLDGSPKEIMRAYEQQVLSSLGFSFKDLFDAQSNAYALDDQLAKQKTSLQEPSLEEKFNAFSQALLLLLHKEEVPSFFSYYHLSQSPREVFLDYYHYLKTETKNNFATPNYPLRFLAYYFALNYPEWFGFSYQKEEPISIKVYEAERWMRLRHFLYSYAHNERIIVKELNKHIKRGIIPPGTKMYGLSN